MHGQHRGGQDLAGVYPRHEEPDRSSLPGMLCLGRARARALNGLAGGEHPGRGQAHERLRLPGLRTGLESGAAHGEASK